MGRTLPIMTSSDAQTTAKTGHKPLLDLIILDCPDALALGTFYSKLLGWELEDGSDKNWATLAPPGGGVTPERPDGRATLAFQRIEDWVAPTWPGGAHPQQFHLDLSVGDIDAAEPEVIALGATVHDHQPSTDGHFRVYLDPVGHPFCLIR
jgi:predicted enzyme related to lactoylglutathione lyase